MDKFVGFIHNELADIPQKLGVFQCYHQNHKDRAENLGNDIVAEISANRCYNPVFASQLADTDTAIQQQMRIQKGYDQQNNEFCRPADQMAYHVFRNMLQKICCRQADLVEYITGGDNGDGQQTYQQGSRDKDFILVDRKRAETSMCSFIKGI